MNRSFAATAIIVALGLSASTLVFAQTAPPVGGPDAKGNAPLKHPHTINDGSAKPGANSFTQGQARQHILNSGYTDVSGLTKGADGVWRGTATRNGMSVPVAMDFKGNVTDSPPATSAASADGASTTGMASGAGAGAGGAAGMAAGSETADASASRHVHHHRRHHARRGRHCVNPGPNGVACSGVDTTGSGISDREKRAMQAGAHP